MIESEFMDESKQKELEQLIHGELRRLPPLKAPETLVHRVMLAVHEKQRAPWWQRSWLAWPVGTQLASLLILLVSAGLVSYLLGAAWDGVDATSLWQRVTASFAWLQPFWEIALALINTIAVVFRAADQRLFLAGAGVVVAAYLACVGMGTVCVRFAFKRA